MCEVSAHCPLVRMIQSSPSTGCSHCRADGDTSPVLLHTTECHSTCFPSWSSITHQMLFLRKASQAMIFCAIGPTSFHTYSGKGIVHGPWSTTLTLMRNCNNSGFYPLFLLQHCSHLDYNSVLAHRGCILRFYTGVALRFWDLLSISNGIWFSSQIHLNKNSETCSLENIVCKKYKR